VALIQQERRQIGADPVDEALENSASSLRSPRMFDADDTSALEGSVHWKPAKSIWISGMTLTALIGGPIYFTWGALALFVVTTALTVCLAIRSECTGASFTAHMTARCGWSGCSCTLAHWSAWPVPTA